MHHKMGAVFIRFLMFTSTLAVVVVVIVVVV